MRFRKFWPSLSWTAILPISNGWTARSPGSDNFIRMLRREFLASLAAAPALFAKSRIDRGRISFITDEASASPADSVAFAKQYGLHWVELRDVPGGGGHYMRQPDEKLKEAAKLFHDNGIQVSFLNS